MTKTPHEYHKQHTGNIRVTHGTYGYIRMHTSNVRATYGYIRVTYGYMRVTYGYGFWRGFRFVLLVGLCTKRRPWSNFLITPNLVAPCFCFGRKLCSSLFQVISSDFKTILTGSSFCTFGRVMYKTKTLLKFDDNCKPCCSLFLLRSGIMFEPFFMWQWHGSGYMRDKFWWQMSVCQSIDGLTSA